MFHAHILHCARQRPSAPRENPAQRDLPGRAAEIEGLRSFYVLRAPGDELLVVLIADHEQALDEMRAEVGNAWMRENIVPHAAAPPERLVGEAVVWFERA